jgi:hypothetical protein
MDITQYYSIYSSILADDGATVLQLQQTGDGKVVRSLQSSVEEDIHSRMQISRRFEASSSISSLIEKSNYMM